MKLVKASAIAFILIISVAVLDGPAALAVTPQAAPVGKAADKVIDKAVTERTRIEELFIWKASEELKLSASDEAKFTTIIRNHNARRRTANLKMDAALAELAKVKTKPEADKALAQHRKALGELQTLQASEIDQLKPLLGSQKLAQYLVVKNSILEKLKILLSAPTPPAPQAVASPESSTAK